MLSASMAKILNEDPGAIHAGNLTKLRRQVDKLVSLIENQLYCIAGLNASDNAALQEPHRKAYIQDPASEVKIAQRGIYRLEARVNDLHAYYQMAGAIVWRSACASLRLSRQLPCLLV
jgi:hypothetical protein